MVPLMRGSVNVNYWKKALKEWTMFLSMVFAGQNTAYWLLNEPLTPSLHHRSNRRGWCFLSCPRTNTPIEQSP